MASDPGDPVQGFDEASELQGTPLEVDAQSVDDAAAAQDLAELESEVDEIAGEDDVAIAKAKLAGLEDLASPRDAVDRSSEHTPVEVERDQLAGDLAAAEGQNWVEALETSAIESGVEPGRELDAIADDEDAVRPSHAASTRDKPVADYGSGGRHGL